MKRISRLIILWMLCVCAPAQALSFLPWEGMRAFQNVYEHDGVERYASVLYPAVQKADAPAVFLLPYNRGNAPAMANLTEAGQLVRDYGVWVFLPVSVDGEWAHNPSRPNQPDDVGFLSMVIEDAIARYPIDPKRIYMTGYSAGGNMSMRFACERPDLVAAVANVAATMRQALARVCQPGSPVGVAFMHGTADDQVPYDPARLDTTNILLRGAMGAREAAEFWAGLNACGSEQRRQLPDLVSDLTHVVVDDFRRCRDGFGVSLFTIENGGHAWPGSLDFIPRVGLTTQDIVGIQELWKFFRQYSR